MGKLLDIDDSDVCIIEEIEITNKKKRKTYRKCSGVGGKVPRNQIPFRPIRKSPSRKSLNFKIRGGQTEITRLNSSSDNSGRESNIEILYEQEEVTDDANLNEENLSSSSSEDVDPLSELS